VRAAERVVAPAVATQINSLECCNAQSAAEMGQIRSPRFAAGMEELARRPDASEANNCHAAG